MRQSRACISCVKASVASKHQLHASISCMPASVACMDELRGRKEGKEGRVAIARDT